MNITERLFTSDPELQLFNEGLWHPANESVPLSDYGYHSFNDAGVECETGELLYSMVSILKADHVLETGTHVGVGSAYLGMALQDQAHGHLDTIEFIPEHFETSAKRFARLGLSDYITQHLMDANDFQPEHNYDLILLDTEPQTRFAEMQKFWPYLKAGGFLFIHDLHRHMHQIPNEQHGFAWPFGEIPRFIKDLVASGHARPFHFPTPRGLTGFYKVSDEDYEWQK